MSKPYAISYDYRPPLLRARVTGNDSSPQVTLAYWCEIAERVRECGAGLLLFLDGIDGPVMRDEDLPWFFDKIASAGLQRVRIAYVERSLEQMVRIEAVELMAREQGYQVRMFAHEQPALDWLRYGE